ncbi:MAG: metallophosphoesterase [Bacteroidetes bacterium]|nr:metallophosphoesterase [Bacteroidota bacterium]MDA1121245.1 metallophosphoesterase [Bacteroidota bacterium]
MNRLVFVIFLALFILIFDFYVFQAVRVVSANWNPNTRKAIIILYWLLTALTLFGIFAYNFWGIQLRSLRTIILVGTFINVFSKVFASLFIFAGDLIRLGEWAWQSLQAKSIVSTSENTISRSEFISKVALAAGAIPVATFSFGIISGAHDYKIRRIQVNLPNLPKAFDGIRIGQVSDIHSGSFFNKKAVLGGVEMMLAEKPDVLFFTGDLVNNESSEVQDYMDIFSKLQAPLGVFSILGNHDYGDYRQWDSPEAKRQNLEDLKIAHKQLGWDLLLNENRFLTVDGEKIAILGIENWGARGFTKYGDLKKAYQGTKNAPVKLLLSHDPSHWDTQVRPGYPDIDLTFAGHTHGFQFGVEIGNFKWSPSQYFYKQWAGLYTEGAQKIYVNRGFGFLGYPGRVGIMPELTILELNRG